MRTTISAAVVLLGAFCCQAFWLAISVHEMRWAFGIAMSLTSAGFVIVATTLQPAWWKWFVGLSLSPISVFVLLPALRDAMELSRDERWLVAAIYAIFALPALVAALAASRFSSHRA